MPVPTGVPTRSDHGSPRSPPTSPRSSSNIATTPGSVRFTSRALRRRAHRSPPSSMTTACRRPTFCRACSPASRRRGPQSLGSAASLPHTPSTRSTDAISVSRIPTVRPRPTSSVHRLCAACASPFARHTERACARSMPSSVGRWPSGAPRCSRSVALRPTSASAALRPASVRRYVVASVTPRSSPILRLWWRTTTTPTCVARSGGHCVPVLRSGGTSSAAVAFHRSARTRS